ncbi:hypothetical protein [Algicola sagamiensis]|uniref:hypothetical protein n=1 Tax=Algicola sagamiensis TaxID=163869 RepID=UPI001B7FE077|nr:hypothetical protein [Algicola sagamiensis]
MTDFRPIRLVWLIAMIPMTIYVLSFDLQSAFKGELTLTDWFFFVIFYSGLFGVYCFLFGIRALTPIIWRIFWCIDFSYNVFKIYTALQTPQLYTAQDFVEAFLYLTFVHCYYFIFFLYAFASPTIWDPQLNKFHSQKS